MNGKRFDFMLIFGEDEHKGLIFSDEKVMKTIDVVYLLNKQEELIDYLQAENQHMRDVLELNELLKKSIKRQQLSNEECSKYIEEVAKENEQLKQEIENLKDANVRCCNEYSYFHKRMMKLEKENEELKSTNMKMEDYIGRLETQVVSIIDEFNFIQNSIADKIINQKTEVGEKALREVLDDYNEWLEMKKNR